jgi:flagellar motor switch protein FliG
MTPSLAGAIADLVAGSVSGLDSQDVRIVDGAGTSYRAGSGASASEAEFHRRQLLEAYHAEKVRQALCYIENLVVSVTVIPSGATEKLTASLAVPRTYLAAAVGAAAAGRSASPEESANLASAELARIQQASARVLNIAASDVQVDCYHDVANHSASEAGGAVPPPSDNRQLAAAAAGFGVALLAGFLVLAVRHVRSRKLSSQVASGGDKTKTTEPSATADSQVSGLALLETLSAADIASVLRQEHPQAVAAVLGHLPAAKAAAILAGLEGPMQAEVSRRLTEMQPIDPATLEELVGQLAARLKGGRAKTAGEMDGQDKMAEILRQADPETERAVLQALAGQAPSLADSVRRRMLVFEDIAELPADRLGAALETVSGEDLAIALRTAAGEFKDKILSCLSARASDRLREETERIGPVRLSEVESAQQRVAQAVRDAQAGWYVSAELSERRQLLA